MSISDIDSMEDSFGISSGMCSEEQDLEADSCDEGTQIEHSGYVVCENIANNELASHLASSGLAGVAAASAISTPRKHNRNYSFEENPAMRRRQASRILRKLQQLIEEFNVRVGQQAVVFVCSPRTSYYAGSCNERVLAARGMPGHVSGGDSSMGNCMNVNNGQGSVMQNSASALIYKVYGSSPLDSVIKNLKPIIASELENALESFRDTHLSGYSSLTFSGAQPDSLPPLMVDGIPTTLDKMTQAQLRAFIPIMLKYSTGKGKPGWGNINCMPAWWPEDVPWANVRSDVRSEAEKARVSWTAALKKVVRQCYMYYGRGDLLEDPIGGMVCDDTQNAGQHHMLHHSESGILSMEDPSLHHGLNMCSNDENMDGSCDQALLHQQATSGHHVFLTSTGVVAGSNRTQSSILHHPQLTSNNRVDVRCVTGNSDGLLNNCDTSEHMGHTVYSISTVVPHMHDSSNMENGSVVDDPHQYHSIQPYAIKTEEDGSISFYQYATSDVQRLAGRTGRVVDVSSIVSGQQSDCLDHSSRSSHSDTCSNGEKENTLNMHRSAAVGNTIDQLTGRMQSNTETEISSGGVVSLPAGTVVQLGNDNNTAFIQFVTCVPNEVQSDHNSIPNNPRNLHTPISSPSQYYSERTNKNG